MALMSPHGLHTPSEAQAFQAGGQPAPQQNQPPIGSSPANVADNIPAHLSEGEFVVPANVVKFYGLKHFQGLIQKAHEGLNEMDQSGLLKQPPAQPQPASSSPATQPPPQVMAQTPPASPGNAAPAQPQNTQVGGPMVAGGGYMDGQSICAADGVYINGGNSNGFMNGGTYAGASPQWNGYAAGGMVHPSAVAAMPHAMHMMAANSPAAHRAPINFKMAIPHNTGIMRTGISAPFHRDASPVADTAQASFPVAKMAGGGYMQNGFGNSDLSGQGGSMNSSAPGQGRNMNTGITPSQPPVYPYMANANGQVIKGRLAEMATPN